MTYLAMAIIFGSAYALLLQERRHVFGDCGHNNAI